MNNVTNTGNSIKNVPFECNNLTNTELENEIIRYLMQKIQSENFDMKDLSFDGLIKKFGMSNETDKNRLKKLLETLENDKLLKRRSGIEIYIPLEVQNHPNIKTIKPVRLNELIIQYIIGFVVLILLIEVPYLDPYLSNVIRGLFSNQSAIPLIVLSAAIGFFLPIPMGYVIYKAYFYILSVKPNISKRFLLSLSLIGFFIIGYILLIYLLNLIYNVDNKPTAEGIFTAIGCSIALIVALPYLSKYFKKKNGKDKEKNNEG